MADQEVQQVAIPKPLWAKMLKAAKKRKPKTYGKELVALACEEFLKAEKANK